MLFSIIIPIYNTGEYLDDCIKSVLSQDNDDYELLLIDDGSTDSSSIICRRWSERCSYIRFIPIKRQGTAAARNVGLHSAKGEYIIFLDSDDEWSSQSVLSEIRSRILKRKIDVLSYNYSKNYDGRISKSYFKYKTDYRPTEDGNEMVFIRKHHLWISCVWNKAIRKDVVIKNSLFFCESDPAEDIDWCYRLGKCAERFDYIGKPYVHYRQREGSVSKTITAEKVRKMISVYQNISMDLDSLEESDRKSMLEDYYAYLLASYLADVAFLNDRDSESRLKTNIIPLLGKMKNTNNFKLRLLYGLYFSLGYHNLLKAIRKLKG